MEALGMPAVIRLRINQFEKIRVTKGWGSISRAAREIGVEPATLFRILEGKTTCGAKFIASLLVAVEPFGFDDLFVIETSGSTESQPAAVAGAA